MRVAIVFTGVDHEFVGGAERFFADFYDIYNRQKHAQNKLFFITNKKSFFIFSNKLNKLHNKKQVLFIPNVSNRFKNELESLSFLCKVIFKRIDIIHIGSYGKQYYHLLKSISILPFFLRPKVVINIVDCEIPYILQDPLNPKYEAYHSKYIPLFKTIHIDGVYSWYKLFKDFALAENIIVSKPLIENVSTRFSDVSRFFPGEKANEIVYAARLTEQKKPLFFLEAIKILKTAHPEAIENWKFLVYGNGPLDKVVSEFIDTNDIATYVSHFSSSDLSKVFSKTKCFVSTQDYENFPSLSMCEAMAAGNAVIARNVGQTDYFVKHTLNGYLLDNDTPEALAESIKKYIINADLHASMQKESIRLTTEVHTSDNFIKDIDVFWQKIRQRK